MSGNGSLQIDVLSAVLFVESPANVGVHVLIEGFQLLPQSLQVLLKGWGFIQGAPEGPIVGVTYRQYQGYKNSFQYVGNAVMQT